eukprot:4707923-Amphidinium_carterae.1
MALSILLCQNQARKPQSICGVVITLRGKRCLCTQDVHRREEQCFVAECGELEAHETWHKPHIFRQTHWNGFEDLTPRLEKANTLVLSLQLRLEVQDTLKDLLTAITAVFFVSAT